jgi:peptidoglycan/LPS O-acetylase OafA/YrhL
MEYRREIDGLRAIAIIPVIFFHAGFTGFNGGFVGVDIFFVISGYLIASIILLEKQAGTFTLLGFYERRARRILPALFAVLFACLPFAWLWLKPADLRDFYLSVAAVSSFTSNVLFWQVRGDNDVAASMMPLLHTWSLAVEEQYYLLFPIFLQLTWRFGKTWIVCILLAFAIISLALAQWLVIAYPLATFFLLPTRGWEILIGAFVAFNLNAKNSAQTEGLVNHSSNQFISLLGLTLIVYSLFTYDREMPFPSVYALVPTLGTALVILHASAQTLVGKLLGSRLFVGIGLLSYSAYLWHQPVFSFARYTSQSRPGTLEMFGLTIISLALAIFSWKYIEMPFRRQQHFTRTQIFAYAIILSGIFFATGLLGYLIK